MPSYGVSYSLKNIYSKDPILLKNPLIRRKKGLEDSFDFECRNSFFSFLGVKFKIGKLPIGVPGEPLATLIPKIAFKLKLN